MSDRPRDVSHPSEPQNPDQTTDLPPPTPAPGPDQTTDLAARPVAAPDTGGRADTSLDPNRPAAPTETHVREASFDPARTGPHTPTHEPEPAESAKPFPTIPGYEILGELGRGGMGVVYKARQVGLGRIVALKMILAGPHASRSVIARFLAEAQAVARFQHPNIVQIHEIGEFQGMPYFSLEFVDGGTLSRKIAREPQPPRDAAELVEQLARAVQYAHDRGIVHRDLKPANILLSGVRDQESVVSKDGRSPRSSSLTPDSRLLTPVPKITDFGLAKALDVDSGQTQSGQILGTPSYMAPEQARGEVEQVGPLADVYGLGAILYDLLTGRPPFAGSSLLDTLEMVRTREPVAPGQLAAKVPRDLETICLKCLSKEPRKRYGSAGELADDLRRFLDGRPIVARPVGAPERTWRWAKRNPFKASALVSGAVALVVLVILSWQLSVAKGQAEENAKQANEAKGIAQGKQKEAEDARDDTKKALAREQIAKGEAEKALGVAPRRHRVAIDTIRGVIFEVDRRMRNNVTLAPLRLQIITAMLADLDKIRDSALDETPLEGRTEAAAYSLIGDLYFRVNRVSDAALWLNKASAVVQAAAKDDPNDPALLHNLASIQHLLADAEWRLGHGLKARELHAAGLKVRLGRTPLVEQLVRDGKLKPIDGINARMSLALSQRLLAFADLRLGSLDEAAENFLASDKMYASLPPASAGSLEVRRYRADIQLRLGDVRLRQGDFPEAEKHYRDALMERETLLKITPKPPAEVAALKNEIAHSRLYLGDFLLMAHNDRAAAAKEYAIAMDLFAGLLKADPDSLDLRQRIAAVHYRLGVVATDPAKAAEAFAECLKLREELAKIDPNDVPVRSELMLVLGRLGRSADAEKLAEQLLKLPDRSPQVLFQVACGLSVASASATDPAVAARCRNRAFEVLEDLLKTGWKDRGSLELDPDLAAIRGDERFAKLLERLALGGKK